MLYKENNGVLRWFAVFGAALGMLLYKKTVGTRFVKLISILIQKELHIAGRILRFIFKPFRWFIGKVKGLCRILRGGAKKTGRCMKKKLTAFRKVFRILLYKN